MITRLSAALSLGRIIDFLRLAAGCLSVEPFELRSFVEVPSDGGDLQVCVGPRQAHEAGSRHAPQSFHVAKDCLDAASDQRVVDRCVCKTPKKGPNGAARSHHQPFRLGQSRGLPRTRAIGQDTDARALGLEPVVDPQLMPIGPYHIFDHVRRDFS